MANVFSHRRSKKSADMACIFVHAGAGYHSVQNEHIHLQACTDAAKAGMQIMRGGGSAADAVEIAIKILEDREVTNAGYGSNLAMDGVVECDAVIVDQHGRSGACGAVAQIKNPICLARLILDHTTTQLTLRRVPPNLLVGQGATEFAANYSMPVLPHDALVSPSARERYLKWKQDLRYADKRNRQTPPTQYDLPIEAVYDMQAEDQIREQMRVAHTRAMEAGTWNEAQPLSPPPSSDRLSLASSSSMSASRRSTSSVRGLSSANTTPESFLDPNAQAYTSSDPYGPPVLAASRSPFMNSTDTFLNNGRHPSQAPNDGHFSTTLSPEHDMADARAEPPMSDLHRSRYSLWNSDGSSADERSISSNSTLQLPSLTPSPEPQQQHPPASLQPSGLTPLLDAVNTKLPDTPAAKIENPNLETTTPLAHPHDMSHPPPPPSPVREDHVTDTVGCIAIDNYGNIACGASSGGIGMKHRGRIGPAALVGVGAAVVPVDPDDKNKTCVASVTSGTGEHMATTMAATVAAERIYHSVKKVKGGALVETDDDEALRSFVESDFMGHPSVKNSNSAGAVGLLVVKKTKAGIYLYFAHNTDSFALASMHSDDHKPVCTMSRSEGNGLIAQGGRAVRSRNGSTLGGGRRERQRQ